MSASNGSKNREFTQFQFTSYFVSSARNEQAKYGHAETGCVRMAPLPNFSPISLEFWAFRKDPPSHKESIFLNTWTFCYTTVTARPFLSCPQQKRPLLLPITEYDVNWNWANFSIFWSVSGAHSFLQLWWLLSNILFTMNVVEINLCIWEMIFWSDTMMDQMMEMRSLSPDHYHAF